MAARVRACASTTGIPARYEDLLSRHPGCLSWSSLAGRVRARRRSTSARGATSAAPTCAASLRSVALATVAVVAYIALLHPTTIASGAAAWVRWRCPRPAGVIAFFFLLAAGLHLRRAAARLRGPRAPGARPAGARRRARRADRRAPAGAVAPSCASWSATPAGLPAGRLRRRRPAQARHARASTGCGCSAAPSELARILDEAEPAEVLIAIPSAPGSLRARVVGTCRERGHPRCARCRPCSSCCRTAATSWARCASCASRTCSAASRCTSSWSASAPTCAARSCW